MSQFSAVDHPNKYRGFPVAWALQPPTDKGSVAVRVELEITEELEGEEFVSIVDPNYAPIRIAAYIYVIKQGGAVNESGVKQLAESCGWDGNLAAFESDPPDVLVQVDVIEETYQGNATLKASWIARGDRPLVRRASSQDVKVMQSTVGSLLRAAAGAAAKDGGPMKRPEPAAPQARASSRFPAGNGGAVNAPAPDDGIPF